MIIITREYIDYPSEGGSYSCTEFKVFDDNDVAGVQEYLDKHNGTFSFKKL